MRKLLASIARVCAIGITLSYCVGSVAAEFEFNRLNACSDVSQVLRLAPRQAGGCRSATGVIERTIRDAAAGSDASVCFLERPPVSALSDFRCMQISGRGAGIVTCYRPASLGDISEYKQNYEKKYAAPTSSYMEAAKRCSGSNGESSPTIETTFPPPLMPVAAHEFGFNVQYGSSFPGTGLATHGFARTSPEVASKGPSAIEYVAYSDGTAAVLRPRTSIGNWRLQVDTSSDFAEPFLRMLKRQGLDAFLAAVDIDLKRTPLAPKLSKSSSLPEELSDIVVSALEDEDFEEMSDDDFESRTGKSKEEATQELSKNVFFGARTLMNSAALNFRLLMKDSGIPCTSNGRGAIGAYIFTLDGNPNMQADFGSISTFLVGLGACASASGSGRGYVRTVANDVKKQLLDDIRTR